MKKLLVIISLVVMSITIQAQSIRKNTSQKGNNVSGTAKTKESSSAFNSKPTNKKEQLDDVDDELAGLGALYLLGMILNPYSIIGTLETASSTNASKQYNTASSSAGSKTNSSSPASSNIGAKDLGQTSGSAKFTSQNPGISIVQFVQSPFGLATLGQGRVTEQEFFDEMKYSFPQMKETASQYIDHFYDYGKKGKIPLTYNGKDMNLAAAYFDEANGNPLRQYIYTFTFEKKLYSKTEVIQFADHILSDLNDGGITMKQYGNLTTSLEDFGEAKGKINNSDIIVSASEESTFDYEVRIIVTKPLLLRR